MKKVLLWSMILLTVCTTGCKQFNLSPDPDDDNNGNNGNSGGNNVAYYIKHSWGSGADEDWSWKKMNKESNGTYTYSGIWGGKGANINTKADDAGATWYSKSNISGASSLSVGDGVEFTYYPASSKLFAVKTSSGEKHFAQVRFCKEKAYSRVLALSVNWDGEVLASYEFGTNSGTTSYYNIQAGVANPLYYYVSDDDDETGWYYAFDDPNYYQFEAGKKYTFTCSDDGTYLTFTIYKDGSMNTPKKVATTRKSIK